MEIEAVTSFVTTFAGCLCLAGLFGGLVIVAASVFQDVGIDLGQYDLRGCARKFLFFIMAGLTGGAYGFLFGIENATDHLASFVLGGGWLHVPAGIQGTVRLWMEAKFKQTTS